MLRRGRGGENCVKQNRFPNEFTHANGFPDHGVVTESQLGGAEAAVAFKPRAEWDRLSGASGFTADRSAEWTRFVPDRAPPVAEGPAPVTDRAPPVAEGPHPLDE
jgi:hypothetical protein